MRISRLISTVLFFIPALCLQAQEISNAIGPQEEQVLNTQPEIVPLDKMDEQQLTNAVFESINAGDTEKLEPLLNALTYYKHNEAGETALTQAILNNNIEMVALLVKDAVINLKNLEGETPLMLAIKQGNPAIIDLISKRAKTSLKNDAGVAPLILAIEKDDLYLIQALIDKGADVNRLSNGYSPTSRATELNRINVLALLIKNGAETSQANENGEIPLFIAVNKGYDIASGILLHKSRQPEKDANWKTPIGETLLNIAVEQGDKAIVHTLLEFGADVNDMNYMENSSLNIAAEKGFSSIATLLLKSGANINHSNILGISPIVGAARNGHKELAGFLAENGADPEWRDFQGVAASDFGSFSFENIDAVFELEDE